MIPTYTNPALEKQGNFKVSEVSAKGRGLKMLIWAARAGTYKDKPLAVVREYTANAVDEHRKNHVKQPVLLHCPTEEDCEFRCRDFALGLNDEDVREVFGMMGESRKDADDVGGLGFGSKVGNSYADSFYVESYHGGKCTTYQFYLTPSKCPTEPPTAEIAEIGCVDSDAPTGIMIRVPVRPEDIYLFKVAFRRVCFYLEGEYTCNEELEFEHAEYKTINGVTYCKAHSDDGFFMMQGGFAYNADPTGLLDGSGLERWAGNNSLLKGWTLVLPKNSFDFTVSREDVAGSVMSKRILANKLHAMTDYLSNIAVRIAGMDLFKMVRVLNKVRGATKYLKIAAPDLKDKLKTDTTYNFLHYGRPTVRHYQKGDTTFDKSVSYNMDIPKPAKDGKFPTVWYAIKKVSDSKRKKILYAVENLGLEKLMILGPTVLEELQEHPIIGPCLKHIDDVEVPRGYTIHGGQSGPREKIAVQVGDIEKAKFYLISTYGKVDVFNETYKVKNGMPRPFRRLKIDKWVVIVPKSEVKKLEGSGLKPFRENLSIIKRRKKQIANHSYLNEMARCPYASMWMKAKGLIDEERKAGSSWVTSRGNAIRSRIKTANPIWAYAIEGGGGVEVFKEIKKMGLTKTLVNV